MKILTFLTFGALVKGTLSNADQKILTPPHQSHSSYSNYAAYIPSPKAQLVVSPAPAPKCGSSELIIKNRAVAINPVDWKIQSNGIFEDLGYPAIIGEDVAGEIVEVGDAVRDTFHVGQRVISYTQGLGNGPAYGGFQLYPILSAAATSVIPDELSFTDAAVLPLSISTAAAGLFMNATLGLKYAVEDEPVLLLWGGSSSVGSSVIQLASAAGYIVITTASASNAQYCKDLGAAHVLDYHDPDVLSNLFSLMKGKTIVGAYDAIGSEVTVRQCASVLHALGGGKIASVGLAPDVGYHNVLVTRMSATNILTQEPDVAKKVWGEYVPKALEKGALLAKPEPVVVGEGLEKVQHGLDVQKKGVSAKKVVITL